MAGLMAQRQLIKIWVSELLCSPHIYITEISRIENSDQNHDKEGLISFDLMLWFVKTFALVHKKCVRWDQFSEEDGYWTKLSEKYLVCKIISLGVFVSAPGMGKLLINGCFSHLFMPWPGGIIIKFAQQARKYPIISVTASCPAGICQTSLQLTSAHHTSLAALFLSVVKASLWALIAHITRMPEMHFPRNPDSMFTDLCSPIIKSLLKNWDPSHAPQVVVSVWLGIMAFESQASYANNSNKIETVLRVQSAGLIFIT